ncbi:hypothetical protein HAZT_HAZT006935 [Hyalella azteca]|uniref:NHR domain-containing protein n=1 Tax=Hyalella azteca TaxID=294128 RepID=A0A6A0GRI1_HYAAZ|nr:hypothetical protein HAZT_HAZT006935 [Hyalella azteca]
MYEESCGSTAHEDFNHGVVLSSRPLRPGEILEVRLDQCVDKWAGSLEIGVTTHSPHSLDYPSTMTNVRTGTWMMTGNGVMHNGTTVIDEYGLNLDRLRVGDRVGVVRHANGAVHFFVNGVDQGVAATGVPETVYGVVDLYGQAAQATIVQQGTVAPCPSNVTAAQGLLKFDEVLALQRLALPRAARPQRAHHQGWPGGRAPPRGRRVQRRHRHQQPAAARGRDVRGVMIEKVVDRWTSSSPPP